MSPTEQDNERPPRRLPGGRGAASAASTAGTPPARARSSISPVPTGATSSYHRRPGGDRGERRQRQRQPAPPRHRAQVDDRVRRPPDRRQHRHGRSRTRQRKATTKAARHQRTRPTIRRPASSASASCTAEPEASTADPGSVMPSVSAMIAIVDAVPIVLHAPSPRPRHVSSRAHCRRRQHPGPPLVVQPPQRGPAPEPLAVKRDRNPVPAGHDQRRDVRAGQRHQVGRDGLVAVAQGHDGVQRLGPDRLLDLDGQQVAVQHGRRLHQVFAERHDREFQRQPAGGQNAPPHRRGQRRSTRGRTGSGH